MNKELPFFLLLGSSFLLGLRHGIDWDHIAAISDITGALDEKHKGFLLGTYYALGHAAVIIILGLAAVLLGINLPDWVDTFMEPIVGITLILLGIWLISSIIIQGKNYQMKSRWMLIFAGIKKLYYIIHQKISHKHTHPHLPKGEIYTGKAAFTIGLIHGIGAETPSQVLLFVTAAGAAGSLVGIILVFAFVLGLLISNSAIVVISVSGFMQIHKSSYLRIILGLLTAFFSLILGIMFIFHQTSFLPVLLGG